MHIAMIGQKHVPSREGGIEVVVTELSARLVAQGHKVTCYNRSSKHVLDRTQPIKNKKEYKGINIKKVPTFDKKGLAALTSSFFATLCALFSKAEVVHYHAEGPCAWTWIVKWFSNKKIVATIHGLDWQRSKWNRFASAYIRYGERMAVKYADEIIVLNKSNQKYFKETYDRATTLIPNGISRPTEAKPNIITKKFGLKGDDYILYLGRIVPDKGIDYLIKAFSKLKTNKKLIIAGSASDTEDYYNSMKQLASHDKRIMFTGFVQAQELDELYSNAHIYVLPSDAEGMSMGLLEAMSYGNCCVVSNIPENCETIQDKGITFKKSNVKDLSRILQKLCGDSSKVKKYKKESKKYILEKYDWTQNIDKTTTLYKINHNTTVKYYTPLTIMYILALSSYLITVSRFGMGSTISQIRYFILLIACIYGMYVLIKEWHNIKIRSKSLLLAVGIGFLFFIISYFKAQEANMPIVLRVYTQIFLIVAPAVYAFCLINLYDLKSITNIMKLTLWITIIAYFTESGHTIIDFFDFNNWSHFNPLHSNGSFTESFLCSEIFVQTFFFFLYFKSFTQNKAEQKSLTKYMWLAFVFALLSFKRLSILCCIVFLLLSYIINFNRNFFPKKYIFIALLFSVATVLYVKFMNGNIFTNIDVYKLTTGRNYILSLWRNKNYYSYGFGTSMLVIGRYLEMDLVQIYLELGLVALLAFCYTYFFIARKNNYTTLVMIYAFLNLLTASSIPTPMSWIITFVTIGYAISQPSNNKSNNVKSANRKLAW